MERISFAEATPASDIASTRAGISLDRFMKAVTDRKLLAN
jgi:hypothetical protein